MAMHNKSQSDLPKGMHTDTIVVHTKTDNNNARTISLSQMHENINSTIALTGMA